MRKKGIDPLFWMGLVLLGLIFSLALAYGLNDPNTGPGIIAAASGLVAGIREVLFWVAALLGTLALTAAFVNIIRNAGEDGEAGAGAAVPRNPNPSAGSDGRELVHARRGPTQATKYMVPDWALGQLNRYTHDANTSARLLDNLAVDNPGQSWDWLTEKAVYDITRDRRS